MDDSGGCEQQRIRYENNNNHLVYLLVVLCTQASDEADLLQRESNSMHRNPFDINAG